MLVIPEGGTNLQYIMNTPIIWFRRMPYLLNSCYGPNRSVHQLWKYPWKGGQSCDRIPKPRQNQDLEKGCLNPRFQMTTLVVLPLINHSLRDYLITVFADNITHTTGLLQTKLSVNIVKNRTRTRTRIKQHKNEDHSNVSSVVRHWTGDWKIVVSDSAWMCPWPRHFIRIASSVNSGVEGSSVDGMRLCSHI